MRQKRHKPEEIVAKLRQVDVPVSQGQAVADAIRAIGVTEVSRGRKLATALHQRAPACVPGLPTSGSGGGRAGTRRAHPYATPAGFSS